MFLFPSARFIIRKAINFSSGLIRKLFIKLRSSRERLYILYIFQLAFSSQQGRHKVFKQISDWDSYINSLPEDVDQFDWRTFQQEYRDYIDLAKMAQLIPLIGAAVGAIVNYKLIEKLGETAINCYRIRKVSSLKIIDHPKKSKFRLK